MVKKYIFYQSGAHIFFLARVPKPTTEYTVYENWKYMGTLAMVKFVFHNSGFDS